MEFGDGLFDQGSLKNDSLMSNYTLGGRATVKVDWKIGRQSTFK